MSAVEGKQIPKGEKVTAVVPCVEKEAKMLTGGHLRREYAESCNLLSIHVISGTQAERGLELNIFARAIDFMPTVGYANTTFAVRPPND
jgi:hypothetical protein